MSSKNIKDSLKTQLDNFQIVQLLQIYKKLYPMKNNNHVITFKNIRDMGISFNGTDIKNTEQTTEQFTDMIMNNIVDEIERRKNILKSLNLDDMPKDKLYTIKDKLSSKSNVTFKNLTFQNLKNMGLHVGEFNNDEKVGEIILNDIINEVMKKTDIKERQNRNDEIHIIKATQNPDNLKSKVIERARVYRGKFSERVQDLGEKIQDLGENKGKLVGNMRKGFKNAGNKAKIMLIKQIELLKIALKKARNDIYTLEYKLNNTPDNIKYIETQIKIKKIIIQKMENTLNTLNTLLKKEREEDDNEDLSGGKYKNPKKSRKLHHRLKRKRLRTRRRHMHRLR